MTNLHEASQPNFLEGFFRGCPQFNLESSPLMQRIVELKENSYADKDSFDYAPEDYADAIDSYNRVLEVAGDITANTIFPNSEDVDAKARTAKTAACATQARPTRTRKPPARLASMA